MIECAVLPQLRPVGLSSSLPQEEEGKKRGPGNQVVVASVEHLCCMRLYSFRMKLISEFLGNH